MPGLDGSGEGGARDGYYDTVILGHDRYKVGLLACLLFFRYPKKMPKLKLSELRSPVFQIT
jgi:hypothetical protein